MMASAGVTALLKKMDYKVVQEYSQGKMLAFALIQEDGMQFANNIYICFSGRGDRHRWLSLPVPPSLQECDAVANLSDDGNQLQV